MNPKLSPNQYYRSKVPNVDKHNLIGGLEDSTQN